MDVSTQQVRNLIADKCHLLNIPNSQIEKGSNFGAYLKSWLQEPFEECVAKGVEFALCEESRYKQ